LRRYYTDEEYKDNKGELDKFWEEFVEDMIVPSGKCPSNVKGVDSKYRLGPGGVLEILESQNVGRYLSSKEVIPKNTRFSEYVGWLIPTDGKGPKEAKASLVLIPTDGKGPKEAEDSLVKLLYRPYGWACALKGGAHYFLGPPSEMFLQGEGERVWCRSHWHGSLIACAPSKSEANCKFVRLENRIFIVATKDFEGPALLWYAGTMETPVAIEPALGKDAAGQAVELVEKVGKVAGEAVSTVFGD
jgi:hypothetical protein